MTSLTADRRCPATLRAAPLALAVMLALECRAEVRVLPGVDLRERYTDNVALAREGQERGRFVTEIAPSLSIASNSPSLRLSARYHFSFADYFDSERTSFGPLRVWNDYINPPGYERVDFVRHTLLNACMHACVMRHASVRLCGLAVCCATCAS